jgi:predicted secreted protein
MAHRRSIVFHHLGNELTIEMSENPATGYAWKVESHSPDLMILSSYTPDDAPTRRPRPQIPPEGPLVGGSGTRCFRIRAKTVGRHSLVLVHQRPWMIEAPLERREYTVVTEPAE